MLSGFTSDVWRTGSNAVRTRCGQLAHEDTACREPKKRQRSRSAQYIKEKRSSDSRGLRSHAQANIMVQKCSWIRSKCLQYVCKYYSNAHHAQTPAGAHELSVVQDRRTPRSALSCSQACASVRRAHEELCAKSAHARSEWLKAASGPQRRTMRSEQTAHQHAQTCSHAR